MYCLYIVTTGMEMGLAFTSVPPLTIDSDLLTVAEHLLHGVVPGVDCHHQHEPHRGGEQRGEQEVGDGAEGDHARHLGVQAGRACSRGGVNVNILTL